MSDIDPQKFRSLVPLIREQLPDYVLDADSVLPDFLEAYYEWMENEGNPTEVINQAVESKDINYTLDRFYSQFKEEYLNKFPRNLEANKENLVKNIREFYRSKGTEKAVKLLFRILFDEEIEVQYPSEQILKPSTGTWIKKTIVRVTGATDDIFNASGREVYFLEQKVVLSGVSGTFTVGETVDSKDSMGNVYQTGEIHSIENNTIIITTDFEEQFRKNLTLEGRSSNATGTIEQSEDFSKRAFVESVNKLTSNGTSFYECEISGLYDAVKSGLIIRTIYNDSDNPVVEFRNSPMVVGYIITEAGTEYNTNVSLPLDSSGGGSDFAAIISSVKFRTKEIPGTFTAVSALPSDVLQYTPHDSETLESLFAPGDYIRIDSDRYQVESIDIANQRLTTTEDVTSGSSLGSIVKSYDNDTRGIAGITITNPGYGYDTIPTLDLSGLGNGDAKIELVSGGSFTVDSGYIDDKGQPSSTMRIQNDGLYQEFSYVVRSGNSINLWRNTLIDHAHPAGMLVSGEIYSVTSGDNINLQLYLNKIPFGGVNFDDNDYISSRNFFEPLILIGGTQSLDDLRVLGTEDSIFDIFPEFVYQASEAGSHNDGVLYSVPTINNGPFETIDYIDSNLVSDTIENLSAKYFRGTTLIEVL